MVSEDIKLYCLVSVSKCMFVSTFRETVEVLLFANQNLSGMSKVSVLSLTFS